MMDVFFCTAVNNDPLREAMANLCLQRWILAAVQSPLNIRILKTNEADLPLACCEASLPGATFQKQRRIYADTHAQSEIYMLADDDCLPGPENFVGHCLEIMERHRGFAVLSLQPRNAKINTWGPPEDYDGPLVSMEVAEHISVGGIRFCRKGALKDWPAYLELGYDMAQCEALRKAGWRSGYFLDHYMLHLGEGYSTIWREMEAAHVH